MPRVSQGHLDARRQQILDAARVCFVRNGFHATSMQDILREADLSTGALYRYFKSKEDIIAAIAQDVLAEVMGAFTDVIKGDAPLLPVDEVFFQVWSSIEHIDRTRHICKLAVQVWGEAQRVPALAERVTEIYSTARDFLIRLVQIYQEDGRLPREVPADRIARVLLGFVPGFMVQRALFDDVDAVMFGDGLRALLTGTGATTTA